MTRNLQNSFQCFRLLRLSFHSFPTAIFLNRCHNRAQLLASCHDDVRAINRSYHCGSHLYYVLCSNDPFCVSNCMAALTVRFFCTTQLRVFLLRIDLQNSGCRYSQDSSGRSVMAFPPAPGNADFLPPPVSPASSVSREE